MAPGIDNFTIYQWSTFERSYAVKQSDGITAMDLTGYTITSQLRKASGALAVTFTITVTNAAGGLFKIALTDEQTGALTPNTFSDHEYDIKFAPLSGVDFRAIEGDALDAVFQRELDHGALGLLDHVHRTRMHHRERDRHARQAYGRNA